ncbi:MAG: MOSC N-terminal beta barrel domain-containing protein [Acidimicrobiia bacterium]
MSQSIWRWQWHRTGDQLWRYPVKSMGGERLDEGAVTATGMVGDRAWAVRDEGGRRDPGRQEAGRPDAVLGALPGGDH